VLAGIATAVLLYWWGGRAASRRLAGGGAELMDLLNLGPQAANPQAASPHSAWSAAAGRLLRRVPGPPGRGLQSAGWP
jgi:hypothetical protein